MRSFIYAKSVKCCVLVGVFAVLGTLSGLSCSGGGAKTPNDGGAAADAEPGASACSLAPDETATVDTSYTLSDKRRLTLHGVSSIDPAAGESKIAVDVDLDGAAFWHSSIVRVGTTISVTLSRDAVFGGSQSETLTSTDGHTWSGTIDGRVLSLFDSATFDVSDPLHGVTLATGEAIETKRVDDALAAGLTTLFAEARAAVNDCAPANVSDGGVDSLTDLDGGTLYRSDPSPQDHGHSSDPRLSAACFGLLAGCTTAQSACIWGGVAPCAGFFFGAAICEGIVAASCIAGGVTCAATAENGGICCPVACGSTACCDRGEICLNSSGACCGASQQGCHGVSCCDQSDTCMPDATCCPAPPAGEVCGNLCCTGGTHCIGGICCPAGTTNVGGQCCPVGSACGSVCCDTTSTCVDPAHSACCGGFTGLECGTSCCDSTTQRCVAGACCAIGSACGSVCCAGGLVCADPTIGACSLPPSSCSPGDSSCLSVQILSPLPGSNEIGINGSGTVTLAASASPIQSGSTVSFAWSWYPTSSGAFAKQIIIVGDPSETWDLSKSGICSPSASSMEDVTLEAYAEDSILVPTYEVLSSGTATINIHILCELLR